MVEIDKKLAEIYKIQVSQPLKLNIRNDIICSLFTNESLENAIQESEMVYGDNYETNRRRKMRLAKLINEKLLLYPLTEYNINCADEIRSVIINSSVFGNFSDFCNLDLSENRIAEAFESFAKTKKSMDEIRNQCYKDLFVLRILWFNNCIHKLITEFPLPVDEIDRKNLLLQKAYLREYINKNAKEMIENVVNNINPQWVRKLEDANLTINGEKQKLTEFAYNQLMIAEKNIARNGYDKSLNIHINSLELAKENIVTFYDIMKIGYKKMLEFQTEDTKNLENN